MNHQASLNSQALENKLFFLQYSQDNYILKSEKDAVQSAAKISELSEKFTETVFAPERPSRQSKVPFPVENIKSENHNVRFPLLGFDDQKVLQMSTEFVRASQNSPNGENRRALFESFHFGIGERCEHLPLLSPLNYISNFTFDQRVDQILSIFQSISTLVSLNDYYTPQYQAACWILYDDKLQLSHEDNLLIERYVYAIVLFATNQGDMVQNMTSPCDSKNILCDDLDRITNITMTNMGLSGLIPTEIVVLPHLVTLDLSSNNLKGSLPEGLGRLKTLKTMNLEKNSISGSIPTEFGMLRALTDIRLASNTITGPIPSELGELEQLSFISFDHNFLNRTIPSEIFNVSSLKRLEINNNFLSGHISTNVHNLESLEILKLSNNRLEGSIPTEIGGVSSLKELWLRSNQMTGTIPAQMGLLPLLERFVIEDNKISGTVPDFFANFTELSVFNVESNKLSGRIPNSFWNVNIMVGVFLDDNELSGTVPEDYCPTVSNFRFDTSSWFLDQPKISCKCCVTTSCHFWKTDVPKAEGTVQPECPENNVMKLPFFEANSVSDQIANATFTENIGLSSGDLSICLSPTGCYLLTNSSDPKDESPWKYSSSTNSLRKQVECDTVHVCKQVFHQNHDKREVLNHITQLAIHNLTILNDESRPEYEALCVILNDDNLFDEYDICDGTILQRYVIAYFFFSNKNALGVKGLSEKHTCDWEGIACNDEKKYVQKLNFTDRGLDGTLITEIGFLRRLKELHIDGNNMNGVINPSILSHMSHLEVFNIRSNRFRGRIPQSLLEVPNLKIIDLANNTLIGSFPDNIEYPPNLETIDVGKNLLRGTIPKQLMDCKKLSFIDLSENGFLGSIPSSLGRLRKLKELRLNQNRLTGSIPVRLFDAKEIETLIIRSNVLTGTVPTAIRNLKNAKNISMSHNVLKGIIPKEFGKLDEIKALQLNNNRFTGEAPIIKNLENRQNDESYSYITDCGTPQFLVANKLRCESCTICCNSLNECQKNELQKFSVFFWGFLYAVLTPSAFIVIFCCHWFLIPRKKETSNQVRNSLSIHNENSVFCLIFSSNWLAWILYFLMIVIQSFTFSVFLRKTSFFEDDTEWAFTMRCGDSSATCADEKSVNSLGWLLFCVVTFSFLGRDFVDSLLQLEKAIQIPDKRFLLSGFLHCYLTTLAFYSSFRYNMALAESNTDLIVNAVILLFINDLDESVLNILDSAVPYWTSDRYDEIEANLRSKRTVVDKKEEKELRGNIFKKKTMSSIVFREEIENSMNKSVEDSFGISSMEGYDKERIESGLKMLGIERQPRKPRVLTSTNNRREKLEMKLSGRGFLA